MTASMRSGLIFASIYWRSFLNMLRHTRRLTLRDAIVVIFLAGYQAGAYIFFYRTFCFIQSFPVIGTLLLEKLWGFFFFVLGLMLIFSNAVIAYSNQYKAEETAFLFTLPLEGRAIFFKQLVEGMIWSSWGFVFLSLPLIIAFGHALNCSAVFFTLTALFLPPFVMIAALAGSALSYIGLALNRSGFGRIALGLFTLTGLAALGMMLRFPSRLAGPDDVQILFFLNRFLDEMSFASWPYFPSAWFSQGLWSVTTEDLHQGMFYLAVMITTTMVFADLAGLVAKKQYAAAWERAQAGRNGARPRRFSKLVLALKIPDLIRKDILLFFRDPNQWIQLVFLMAVMLFYMTNLRSMREYVDHPYWENIVYFMNLSAIGLLLATLSLRFVYPQFSLEWRRSWLIGMIPMSLSKLIRLKFWFFALFFLVLGQALNFFSNGILNTAPVKTILGAWTVAGITFVMTAMSLALGSIYPNMSTDNPSRIMSGLGGVLNLVFSMAYLIVSLFPLSLVFHFSALRKFKHFLFFEEFVCAYAAVHAAAAAILTWHLLKTARVRACTE